METELVRCSGTSERDAVRQPGEKVARDQRATVGADKGYEHEDSYRKCVIVIERVDASFRS